MLPLVSTVTGALPPPPASPQLLGELSSVYPDHLNHLCRQKKPKIAGKALPPPQLFWLGRVSKRSQIKKVSIGLERARRNETGAARIAGNRHWTRSQHPFEVAPPRAVAVTAVGGFPDLRWLRHHLGFVEDIETNPAPLNGVVAGRTHLHASVKSIGASL